MVLTKSIKSYFEVILRYLLRDNPLPSASGKTAALKSMIPEAASQMLVSAPGVAAMPPKETSYFKGEGKLIVKKTEHRGAARKGGPLLFAPVTLGLSYAAFGRDKTRKTEAEGTLVVTNRAIYCAGNVYPFDRILSITRKGKKEVELTFETSVGVGGRGDKRWPSL